MNGPTLVSGRVEVCSGSNNWGQVCDDFWSNNDATVACRQLGLLPDGTTGVARRQAFFGTGSGGFVLDNLLCTGTEASLFDCPHNGVDVHNCFTGEESGIECPASN